MHRRDFIARSALGPVLAAAIQTAARADGQPLPRIALGDLEVSRLILGSNPFFGFSHQTAERDQEMRDYFTPERMVETLEAAAEAGVTAIAAPVYDQWIDLFTQYREDGGRLRDWIAQPDPPPDAMEETIRRAVDAGAAAVFIQGHQVDDRYAAGEAEVVRRWVELIKDLGVPAGMASHLHTTHLAAEEAGFPTDFYFQCLYNPAEGYLAEQRERALDAIGRIEKPVIAYKILAAGRNDPAEGFATALGWIREKDGICVGMFPKEQPGQIGENAELTRLNSD